MLHIIRDAKIIAGSGIVAVSGARTHAADRHPAAADAAQRGQPGERAADSHLQILDLDNSQQAKQRRYTYESVVYTLGEPTAPKGGL